MKTLRLGDRAKDKITGLTGIVTGYTTWLYGCVRIGIQPETLGTDGKVPGTEWFDEDQVQLVERDILGAPKVNPTAGGPRRGEETK